MLDIAGQVRPEDAHSDLRRQRKLRFHARRGVNGSYVFTPGKVYFQETPHVEVADTVGAGDSFTAAFVSGILKGMPVEDAHRLAVCTSAYVCTQNGAMPVLPRELTEM